MNRWSLGYGHNEFLNDELPLVVFIYGKSAKANPVFCKPSEVKSIGDDLYVISRGNLRCLVTGFDEGSAATQESGFAALALDKLPEVGEGLKCLRFRLRETMPVLEAVETSSVVSIEELPEEGLFCVKTKNSTYICAKNPE